MKAISRSELVERVKKIKGTTFISFDSETDARLLKKHRDTKEPCPFDGVIKRSSVSCVLGKDYTNAVNRQTLKDHGVDPSGNAQQIEEKLRRLGLEPFRPKGRVWGERVGKTPVLEYKGESYIECIFREQDEHRITFIGYFDKDGNEIAKEDLEGYLPKKNRSNTQAHNEHEEFVRTFGAGSFKIVRMNGEELAIM